MSCCEHPPEEHDDGECTVEAYEASMWWPCPCGLKGEVE